MGGQRGPQTEIVERGRPELPDQVIDVSIELLGDHLERVHLSGQVGSIGARLLERDDAVAERGQLLAELIVHLAGDPPSLVFLREHQPAHQLGAHLLGALPFEDFGAQ